MTSEDWQLERGKKKVAQSAERIIALWREVARHTVHIRWDKNREV